jgi:hypothetical protein
MNSQPPATSRKCRSRVDFDPGRTLDGNVMAVLQSVVQQISRAFAQHYSASVLASGSNRLWGVKSES